jgi:hypothetical protein
MSTPLLIVLIARSLSNRDCRSSASLAAAWRCSAPFGTCAKANDVAEKVSVVASEMIRRRIDVREKKGHVQLPKKCAIAAGDPMPPQCRELRSAAVRKLSIKNEFRIGRRACPLQSKSAGEERGQMARSADSEHEFSVVKWNLMASPKITFLQSTHRVQHIGTEHARLQHYLRAKE